MTDINEQQTSDAPAEGAAAPTGSFADLGLRPEILKALADMGFTAPMDVQRQTAPVVQSGRDVLVQSRTGSGKTAAFGIPMVDRLVAPEDRHVQAIVLLPTRELALQVAAELARIAAHMDVTVVPVYGGAPMGRQVEQLRAGGQIVCGTPGRILDHLRRGTLKLDRVRCAVLDECDEMLSMGFQEDIERILEHTPAERQTMLFSATLPEGIRRLARRYLRNPVHLKLSADFVGVAEISHLYYTVSGANREADLLRILSFENPGRGIVFCNTREETGRVAEFLRSNSMAAEAISSDLSQSDREKVMKQMREGSIRFLVATDVAARGIDIDDISHVFNFSFPDSPESYIHRTGRTGRAGRHGVAVSLIGPTEVGSFYYLKLLYKIKPQERTLPSEVEIQARREGENLLALRKQLATEPGPQWRALARRVMTGLDAEHLLAGLLKERLGAIRPRPVEAEPEAEADAEFGSPPPPRNEARAPERDRDVDRNGPRRGRDDDSRRGRFGERERGGRFGERERNRDGRRGERGERARPERDRSVPVDEPVNPETLAAEQAREAQLAPAPTEVPRTRPERALREPSGPRSETGREEPAVRNGEGLRPEGVRNRDFNRNAENPRGPDAGREGGFGRGNGGRASEAPRGGDPGRGDVARSETARGPENRAPRGNDDFMAVWSDDAPAAPPTPPRPAPAGASGEEDDRTRLYLNLGRKDRVRAEDVARLLSEAGAPVAMDAIDVMNTHSYIDVGPAQADILVGALNGREHNGRELVCERAKPRRARF